MCRDDHVRLLHTADLHYDNTWLYKKMTISLGGIIRKGGVTGGARRAVQPNIDTDQWYKKFITHAYPQLHISDSSTTQKNKH